MTLGEMRSLLAAEGIRLTRSLGQSFLHDANQLRRIVALADPQPGDPVLEIGPGLGPLTEKLLESGARVMAIEKDARLAGVLQKRLGGNPNLEIIVADALEWVLTRQPNAGQWQVVANLPYSIGSRVLIELAHLPRPPRSMTVTLQAEVVDRLGASPGSSDFGVLTLLRARVYDLGHRFRISPSCFFPAPQVTSACVRLNRRATPLVEGPAAKSFNRLVKLAFSQRRKRLAKVLRQGWPASALAAAWSELGLHEDVRAEALSPEVFARLAQVLTVEGLSP